MVTPNIVQPVIPVISLVSPPAIVHTLSPPLCAAELTQTISNLNDLQSTLEFSNDSMTASDPVDQLISEPSLHTRKTIALDQNDREVVMTDSTIMDNECTGVFAQLSPKQSYPRTPSHVDFNENSQGFSSPRSVVTEPDQQEIDTANILIQMSDTTMQTNETAPTTDYVIDEDHELPVNTERLEDVVDEINKKHNNQRDSTDSDATVEYPDPHKDINKTSTDTEQSPKGHINYKHFGIKRQSPDHSKSRNYKCYLCEAVCHSKQQLNRHHKSEHARVKCPTCRKHFPTPDALQRHRYTHRDDHQFICDICQEVCAFRSDLDNHVEKHKDE